MSTNRSLRQAFDSVLVAFHDSGRPHGVRKIFVNPKFHGLDDKLETEAGHRPSDTGSKAASGPLRRVGSTTIVI